VIQKIYQVDAFADKVFAGNPAAVCPLNQWLSEEVMQKIAAENNLAETAFYVKDGDNYQIRWFTPKVEVDLCGHATLAAAFVLFHYEGHQERMLRFISPRSGELTVSKQDSFLTLNFPTDTITPITLTEEMRVCFNHQPKQAFKGKTDFMFVFDDEEQIQHMVPSFEIISKLGGRGTIITAKGKDTDFVSRFFGPQSGVNEDPVTGSAHTTLIPFWAAQLHKSNLTARQLSERKGFLKCRDLGDRVEISGEAKLYLKGEIFLD
jgi:PhzF family phenazine biosynthesis protein